MVKKITAALLSIIISSLISTTAIADETIQDQHPQLIVYYFHGTFRCPTCRKLEKYAKETIENNFKDELDKETLIFKIINVEEDENQHFIDDYQLYSKSLVLSLVKNQEEIKHKNLTKIWEYVRNKEKYINYVKKEINTFLKETESD